MRGDKNFKGSELSGRNCPVRKSYLATLEKNIFNSSGILFSMEYSQVFHTYPNYVDQLKKLLLPKTERINTILRT
jgi:hypothetical protein